MNTERLLLDAVLREPEDDTVRLAYADWLDEQEPKRIELRSPIGPGGKPKCPKCFNSMQNAIPHGSPHHRRCASCKHVWQFDGIVLDDTNSKRAAAIRWFIANPDYHQSVPITSFVPSLTEYATSGEVCGVWHRGFGSEVRMRCADFMTHAAAIFSEHPVTRVVLTDREPAQIDVYSGTSYWRWWWNGDRVSPDRQTLPTDLYESLDGSFPSDSEFGSRYAYPSVENANLDLSRACVQFGRAAALRFREGKEASAV